MTALAVVLLITAAALGVWALRQRQNTDAKKQELRLEGNVVYQDAGLKSEVLVSHALGLKGKPDLLTKVDNVVIPVDKKRGRKKRPFDSQVLQLAAYCALVEERYGVRPPT